MLGGIVKKGKRRICCWKLFDELSASSRLLDLSVRLNLLVFGRLLGGQFLADFKGKKIGLITFQTTTYNERKRGNGDFRIEYKKTKFVFCWLCSLAGWKWLTNKLDEKKKQTHWQPEKKKNPFRAVVKVLKRKNFRLRFYISTDFQFI